MESESKGNGSDSGQETKDTAKLTGPGNTHSNTVRWHWCVGARGADRGLLPNE